MSQLLIRFSKMFPRKICPRNNALIHQSLGLFSSSATSPYLALGPRIKEDLGDGRSMGDVLLYDPAKEELVTVPDKVIPQELLNSTLIGSSQGWGFFSENRPDGSLWMSDLYNPLPSSSNPKMIPLPPISALPFCHTQAQLARNVAVSSPPSASGQDKECVVAIKFLGRQISLYRHGRDLQWTNLELPFRSLDSSNLAYSEREQCFYLPSPGGNFLFKWDFNFKEGESLMCRELIFRDLPELQPSEYQMLASCSRAEHWVESSSSGESFLVQWYSFVSPLLRRDPVFMVFREEEITEGSYMCYTEDIGDLCIFLSDSHPFCVKASSCPGLEPNSIYLMSLEDFEVYDLATRTCRRLQPPDIGSKGEPITVPFLPFWIPPLSI